MIGKYWYNNKDEEIKCSWNTNLNNRSSTDDKKITNSKKSARAKKQSSRSVKIIGLTGEKKANEFICDNIEEILAKLRIRYQDINEVKVNWFNANIEIENVEKETDNSVGKGYDIEILVDGKIVKFEVKSSYEGDVNEIVLTRNELIEMKASDLNNLERKITDSPINWYGGKGAKDQRKLLNRILDLIDSSKAKRFVDVFGGSGIVCINTNIEERIFNDKNLYLTHFFRVLQDEKLRKKFQEKITLTLYSEIEFNEAKKRFLEQKVLREDLKQSNIDIDEIVVFMLQLCKVGMLLEQWVNKPGNVRVRIEEGWLWQ